MRLWMLLKAHHKREGHVSKKEVAEAHCMSWLIKHGSIQGNPSLLPWSSQAQRCSNLPQDASPLFLNTSHHSLPSDQHHSLFHTSQLTTVGFSPMDRPEKSSAQQRPEHCLCVKFASTKLTQWATCSPHIPTRRFFLFPFTDQVLSITEFIVWIGTCSCIQRPFFFLLGRKGWFSCPLF